MEKYSSFLEYPKVIILKVFENIFLFFLIYLFKRALNVYVNNSVMEYRQSQDILQRKMQQERILHFLGA